MKPSICRSPVEHFHKLRGALFAVNKNAGACGLISDIFILFMKIYIRYLQYDPSRGFSVSGIITLYLYPPETECVGPDQSARTAQADMG